jgi:hypothetical protein
MAETINTAGSGTYVPPARPYCPPKIKGLSLPESVWAHPYIGRVSTFVNISTASYSETYEPARLSAFGPIGRIESRISDGVRKHIAFRLSGEQIYGPDDDLIFFDQVNMPLMFEPEKEQQFAEACLSIDVNQDLFHYSKGVVIYRNKDGRAVGIVRLQNTP